MADLTPEGFDGGLVTARDAATLEPGELTLANNAIYRPGDSAIHKVRGRTKYNAVALGAAGNVKGLRYLEFDNGSALLAAHESDDIFLSQYSAETGAFNVLTGALNVGSGVSLDAVHYNNRHYLLYGAGPNQVVRTDGGVRNQGLQPVPELTTAPTQVAGAWNSALGPGFYHFLTTEVYRDTLTGQVVESAFTGTPKSVQITTVATQQVSLTQPTLANANATHWRVYMAGPTVAETPIPPISDFRQVGEQDIANTTMVIGNGNATAGRLATANGASGWTNTSNVFSATDNLGMTSTTNLSTALLNTFGFSGLTGVVTGFEVYMRLKITGFGPHVFGIGPNSPLVILDLTHNGVNFFPGGNTRYIVCRTVQGITNGYVTVVLGNQYDLWGRAAGWALGDINGNASFGVRVKYGEEYAGSSQTTVNIDWIRIVPYTTGTARPIDLTGRPYQVVVVSEAGITTVYPSDMPPPVATTGDIFEDQMILNDTGDPSIIRGSLPGNVESFPAPYFVNFETKEADNVTCIRRVGNKIVIGLTHQIYRLNYFPRETDAEFDRGRCYEAISESHGIVGAMAAALFSPDGGAQLLAYVSHDGLHTTDGFQTKVLTNDLDWATTVRLPSAADVTNYLRTSVLVDYPLLRQLWLYYTPPGQTANTKALVLHYDPQHRREDGTLKITGPVDVAALSACCGRLAGEDTLLTGQAAGFVYVEDRGYTHNAGGTIPFSVQSREMYPGGWGGQVTLNSLWVRHRSDSPVSTVTATPITRTSADAQVNGTAKTFTNTNGGVAYLAIDTLFDSLQLKFTEPGADAGGAVRLTQMGLQLSGHGLEESRT